MVQQEEEPMPVVQQKVEQFPLAEEPITQQVEQSKRPQPAKVGIIRWEQHIEQPKKSYKPRKSIYKQQVQQIEQQVRVQHTLGWK